jgi:hypothetical protein
VLSGPETAVFLGVTALLGSGPAQGRDHLFRITGSITSRFE